MPAKRIADRAFVLINGFEGPLIKRASLRRTRNLSRSETMTRNYRSSGFKFGNLGVQLQMEFDIEQAKAQVDIALGDENNDVKVVFECGGERYTVVDVMESEMNIEGSVGDASKSITCEALDVTNENGTSVNVDISLG